MKIKPHPDIKQKLTKLFLVAFISLWALILLCIFGNRFITNFEANHYFEVLFTLTWATFIYFFYTVWHTLKRVDCPDCNEKTVAKSKHELLPDNHSAYCAKCDVLWDLGIGNSD
jgi:predicted neutral ceramidase superfamily lipid hydrolase